MSGWVRLNRSLAKEARRRFETPVDELSPCTTRERARRWVSSMRFDGGLALVRPLLGDVGALFTPLGLGAELVRRSFAERADRPAAPTISRTSSLTVVTRVADAGEVGGGQVGIGEFLLVLVELSLRLIKLGADLLVLLRRLGEHDRGLRGRLCVGGFRLGRLRLRGLASVRSTLVSSVCVGAAGRSAARRRGGGRRAQGRREGGQDRERRVAGAGAGRAAWIRALAKTAWATSRRRAAGVGGAKFPGDSRRVGMDGPRGPAVWPDALSVKRARPQPPPKACRPFTKACRRRTGLWVRPCARSEKLHKAVTVGLDERLMDRAFSSFSEGRGRGR